MTSLIKFVLSPKPKFAAWVYLNTQRSQARMTLALTLRSGAIVSASRSICFTIRGTWWTPNFTMLKTLKRMSWLAQHPSSPHLSHPIHKRSRKFSMMKSQRLCCKAQGLNSTSSSSLIEVAACVRKTGWSLPKKRLSCSWEVYQLGAISQFIALEVSSSCMNLLALKDNIPSNTAKSAWVRSCSMSNKWNQTLAEPTSCILFSKSNLGPGLTIANVAFSFWLTDRWQTNSKSSMQPP